MFFLIFVVFLFLASYSHWNEEQTRTSQISKSKRVKAKVKKGWRHSYNYTWHINKLKWWDKAVFQWYGHLLLILSQRFGFGLGLGGYPYYCDIGSIANWVVWTSENSLGRKTYWIERRKSAFCVFYVYMKQGFSKTQLSYKGGGPSCSKLRWCKKPDKSLSSVIHLLCVNVLCGSESMAQLLYKTLRLTIFLDKWQKVPGKNNDKKKARVLWMVKISDTQKAIPRKKRICFFCCLLQGQCLTIKLSLISFL